MFAFSQVKPETQGQVTDMSVPFSDFIGATAEEALHVSPFAEIYRASELYSAENNDEPKISAEDANRLYPMKGFTYQEPITEEAASLLQDREKDRLDNQFSLTNGNHDLLSKAVGMTTGMVVSMVDPINLAAMFMPVVGEATKLGPMESKFALSALGQGGALHESFANGLITSADLETMTHFPKFATSVLQGAGFMTLNEIPKQIGAATEHEDVGNPFANIAEGTLFAGAMHMGISAAAKAFASASSAAKAALFEKAMNDFATGKDIEVHDLIKTDPDFVRAQMDHEVVGTEGEWPNKFKQEDLLTGPEADAQNQTLYQNKIKGIFDSATEKLRSELPQPKPGETPVIPESGVQPEQNLYSSFLDEIRKNNARTTADVQDLVPGAKLTRQEAALFRRQAWGEDEVTQTVQDNIKTVLDNAAAEVKQPGAKAQARRAAEANMPDPFKIDVAEQAHAQVPENTTIEKVKKAGDTVKKKLKDQVKETKQALPESKAGLVPQSGKLGKQGWFTTKDPGLKALSVHISDSAIHLVNIEAAEKGKGAGSAMIEKLKAYADETGRPITLTAAALEEGKPIEMDHKFDAIQERLEKFYNKLGFESIGDNDFKYTPKTDVSGKMYELKHAREDFTYVGKDKALVNEISKIEEIKPMPEVIKAAVDCAGKIEI